MQAKSGKQAPKLPGRVGLPVTPPKGRPFAGATGLGAPARDTKIPNLTARVAVAKAEKSKLTQGGLVSAAQQKAASDAGKALAAHKQAKRQLASAPATKIPNKPLAKNAPLVKIGAPPAAPLAQAPQRTATPASSTIPLPGSRGAPLRNGRAQMQATQPKQGSLLGGIPGKIASAAASEVGGTLHDPLGSMLLGPGQQVARRLGVNVTNEASKQGNRVAAKIATAGEKTGSIPKSFLSTSQAAQFPGQKTVTEQQIKDLEAQKGGLGGLSQATRTTLIKGAEANGWPHEMAVNAVDSDLIHLYGNKPASPIIQFAKNFGTFAATQAGAPAGIVALGDAGVQAVKGNTEPLKKQAQQFVEGSMVGLPFVGAHPFLHDLYWHPGESAQNLSLVAGLADRAAGAASKFAPGIERTITPEGFTKPISRGTLSERPLERGIMKARDAYVRSQNPILNAEFKDTPILGPFSPRARRTALAKSDYHTTYDRSVAPNMAHSNQLRADVMRAAKKVGNERASALNAYLQGSDPAERASFYHEVSSELGAIKGRGAAAHAKLSEKHPITEATLTPEDHAYVDAVRAAADYQTKTRVGVGQFGETAAKYRSYQEPIVLAAQRGDPLATEVIHTRGQHLWPDPAAQPVPESSAAQTRLRTLETQARKHEKEYGRLKAIIDDKPRRPVAGSGHVAQVDWMEANNKWKTRARTARAKLQVHRTQADQLNAEAERVRGRLRSQDAAAENPEFAQDATHAAYSDALDQFIARHNANGGTTPAAYIPQAVPQTFASGFKREAKPTGSPNIPTMHATENRLVLSGGYRSTPTDVSLQTHRAAVIQSRIDHFKAVDHEYVTTAPNGTPADPNVIYLKRGTLSGPIKLEHTVGEHNLTDEGVVSTLDQMRQALEGGQVKPVNGYVPAHGDIVQMPRTIFDEMHASTQIPKGSKVGQFYDTANRKYQRLMLSKPSTAMANIVGNPILAMMGGASPWEATAGGYRALEHPEHIPPQLLGQGLGGAAGTRGAVTPAGKYIDFSISHQRTSEDAARAGLYHHVVTPYVRKQMAETAASADQVLKDLASGKDPNATRFVKKVEDFLGTMKNSKHSSPGTERMLSRGILFHRWLGHILTMTLYTMPVKYPGRAVLLQRISEIGDDYRKHHGVFPSWYLSMIPLMRHIATGAGVPESFTRVLPTGSVWPTANMPMPLADSEGSNPYAAIIGSTNPVLRSAIEAPTGFDFANLRPYKDSSGAQIAPLSPEAGKLFLGQEYRNIPYTSVVTPMPGRSADSFPGNMHDAVHKNRYGRPLPPGFGTSSIPYGGSTPALTPQYALGALSRLFLGGSGVQDLPAQTRGTNYARTAQMVKARQGRNKIIRERARARAGKPG